MPNYDYSCAACGYTGEHFQKITEPPLVCCPACNTAGLKRGVGGGGAAFKFTGSGFYLTDYCGKGNCGCKDKQ